MSKVYRTAHGRRIDLGEIMLKNEKVRAVGNMGVNARGDLVNSYNESIQTRNQQVRNQYNVQVTNVSDDTIYSSSAQQTAMEAAVPDTVVPVSIEEEIEQVSPDERPPLAEKKEENKVKESKPTGLAAAIAKSQSVKQEKVADPSASTGVKRI
jgi:hypothetical protein